MSLLHGTIVDDQSLVQSLISDFEKNEFSNNNSLFKKIKISFAIRLEFR